MQRIAQAYVHCQEMPDLASVTQIMRCLQILRVRNSFKKLTSLPKTFIDELKPQGAASMIKIKLIEYTTQAKKEIEVPFDETVGRFLERLSYMLGHPVWSFLF
jgi:hypothetical protein